MKIRKYLVPSSRVGRVSASGTNSKKYIVIHETDNTKQGASADAHSRLQYNGNQRVASWHYQVDSKEVVQSFSDNVRCYHAGNSYYNNNSIGIEICVNSDSNYAGAVANAVQLVQYLMKKYKIPAKNVVQHNTASGKNCPRNLRSGARGITWKKFKSDIAKTGGLTVSQYNELKKLINAQAKELNAVKKELGRKQNRPSNSQTSEDHGESMKKLKDAGIMNGKNPHHPLTRGQYASTVVRMGLVK